MRGGAGEWARALSPERILNLRRLRCRKCGQQNILMYKLFTSGDTLDQVLGYVAKGRYTRAPIKKRRMTP
jgi:predicted nucleic-acid-binding Zn-ribbon protein